MTVNAHNRRIGSRYRLVEPLGRGGMGTVWSGVDEVLDREVAIKEVIPPAGLCAEDQQDLRSRTMREARAAARINSRSAVTVYDVVEEDGKPWIVMELLRAVTLADLLRRDGPLPADRVARIGLRLLEALAAAHAAGVLHRDVKPSNVMIKPDGEPVLTDFGIASLAGDPTLTTTGMLIGSPAYMAPERARGGSATPAGDLWSLGCTLYTAVEGRGPFAHQGPLATLTAVITEEPFPPVRAGALAPVLLALLAKDPAARPGEAATADLLAEAARARAPSVPPASVRPVGPNAAVERTRPFRPVSPPPSIPEAGAAPPALPSPEPDPAPGPPAPAPRRSSEPRHRRTVAAPAQSPPRRRVGLAALVGAALLAVGAIVLVALLNGRGEGEPTSASAPSSPTVPAPSTPAPATPAPSAPEVSAPVAVPAGYELYEDPTGFAVAIPGGWQVARARGQTFVREPGGRRFLQVGQTTEPKPDPAADWTAQEAVVSRRLADYALVRIDPLDYRGWAAADWEFTWRAGGGQRHVLNRGFITAQDRAYALYWSVPAEQWEASRAEFEVFAATFRPAS